MKFCFYILCVTHLHTDSTVLLKVVSGSRCLASFWFLGYFLTFYLLSHSSLLRAVWKGDGFQKVLPVAHVSDIGTALRKIVLSLVASQLDEVGATYLRLRFALRCKFSGKLIFPCPPQTNISVDTSSFLSLLMYSYIPAPPSHKTWNPLKSHFEWKPPVRVILQHPLVCFLSAAASWL